MMPAKKTRSRKCSTKSTKLEHQADVDKYIKDIQSGKIVAGKLEVAAVDRHVRDLKTAKKQGFYFDAERADKVITFIELQHHTKGELSGNKFLLQPWQKFVVWCLFGWKRIEDGMRRFRTAYLSMGRGNGKSPFTARLVEVLTFYDEPRENTIEGVLAATKKKQARFVFDDLARNRKLVPAIKKRTEVLKEQINILKDDGWIEIWEKQGRDGAMLHFYVADELHEWKKEHETLYRTLRTSMGKRRQPLGMYITTAGNDRSLIWLQVYNHSSKIARGVIDSPTNFVFICEIDEGDDPFDEKNWRKGNPNLGISVQVDYLRELANDAKENAFFKNEFLRYHMNTRVRSRMKVITPEVWNANNKPSPELYDRQCCGGLDLGYVADLAAFALTFPLGDDGDVEAGIALKLWCWICEETERDLKSEPYASWIRQGFLDVTEGNATDPEAIYEQVESCLALYDVKSIALDPNNARAPGIYIANNLGANVYDFFQTCRKYNEPTKKFLELLADKKVHHGNNPILRWAADNLVLRTDAAGYVMPDKQHSDEKIDPIVATIMGLSECLFVEGDETKNPYESRGLRTL